MNEIALSPASRDAGVFFHPAHVTEPAVAPAAPLGEPLAAPAASGHRHLLGLEGCSRQHLLELLDRAAAWRERWRDRRVPNQVLAGIEVVNAFFEDSTRTRTSFELAERRLGMTPVSFGVQGSSVSKGESVLDTLATIVSMGVDVLVVRHRSEGAPAFAARELSVSVINAGDGAHEHPTQGLLDLLTLRDAWRGSFAGRRVAIVGDVLHSRVARSATFGLTTLGARVTFAGPATLVPRTLAALGADIADTVEDAVAGADAVMPLRLQCERMQQGLIASTAEYARVWGIDAARARRLAPDGVVMHPGPMNRNVEIASDVADGPRSVVLRQVGNGVAVRAAVLAWCAGREAA